MVCDLLQSRGGLGRRRRCRPPLPLRPSATARISPDARLDQATHGQLRAPAVLQMRHLTCPTDPASALSEPAAARAGHRPWAADRSPKGGAPISRDRNKAGISRLAWASTTGIHPTGLQRHPDPARELEPTRPTSSVASVAWPPRSTESSSALHASLTRDEPQSRSRAMDAGAAASRRPVEIQWTRWPPHQ